MITLESLNKMLVKPGCFKKVTAARRTANDDKKKELSKPKASTLATVERMLQHGGIATRGQLITRTGFSKDTVKNCTDWLHANKIVAKRHIGNAGPCDVFEYKLKINTLDGDWI